MPKGKNKSSKLKRHLWFHTYGRSKTVPCHWCNKCLSFKVATVDHEPPLAEGGSWHSAVLACYDCNQRRNREQQERENAKKRAQRVPCNQDHQSLRDVVQRHLQFEKVDEPDRRCNDCHLRLIKELRAQWLLLADGYELPPSFDCTSLLPNPAYSELVSDVKLMRLKLRGRRPFDEWSEGPDILLNKVKFMLREGAIDLLEQFRELKNVKWYILPEVHVRREATALEFTVWLNYAQQP